MGLMIGFGAGYWFGTAAGREKHEELRRMVDKIKRSETFEEATEKARAVVDLSVERAKDLTNKSDGEMGSFDSPDEAAHFSMPQPGPSGS